MSELSEEAYYAGWMSDLEFGLWRIVIDGSGTYGRLDATVEHATKLRELWDRCGGWIVFDDRNEETFLTLEEWWKRYDDRAERGVALRS